MAGEERVDPKEKGRRRVKTGRKEGRKEGKSIVERKEGNVMETREIELTRMGKERCERLR